MSVSSVSMRSLSAGMSWCACLIAALVFGAGAPAQAQRSPEKIANQMGRSREGTAHEEMRLALGEQRVLDAEGVRSFSEGVHGVIDIRLTKDNDKFVLVGLRPGKTSVLFIMLDGRDVQYDITVAEQNGTDPSHSEPSLQKRDNIRLDFYFVQLGKNYSHSLGIGWPSSIEASVGTSLAVNLKTGAMTGASAFVSSQVLPRLDLAQSDGWVKITRKAAVVTANRTEATFSGGGEVNIAVTGGFGGSIKQVTYGSEIKVRPEYDRESGRIELQLSADVSDLTADSGHGVPGRTTSSLQTIVNLELGQSLVLAGLSSASEAAGRSGLPGLSRIPLIGALFGTHTSQTSESETVIFIVPSVIDAVTMQRRALIGEALEAYEHFAGGDMPSLTPQARSR